MKIICILLRTKRYLYNNYINQHNLHINQEVRSLTRSHVCLHTWSLYLPQWHPLYSIHIQIRRFPVHRSSQSLRVREWKIYRIPIMHAFWHRVKPARTTVTQITLFMFAQLPVLRIIKEIIKETPVKTYLLGSVSNSVLLAPIIFS
jgi:hypothetical protein